VTTSRVALIRGEERGENIRRALDAVGDQIEWRGVRRVLVKPNFVCGDRPLAATHVDGVRALLGWLRSHTAARIAIGEGAATCSTWEAFASYGCLALPDEFPGVELCDLNLDEAVPVSVFDWRKRPLTLYVSRTALESDCRISLGPPKTHNSVVLSLSLKNMIMGSLIGRLDPRPLPQGRERFLEKSPGELACGTPGHAPLVRLRGHGLYSRLPGGIRRHRLLEWVRVMHLTHSPTNSKQRMHQGLVLLHLNLFALAPLLYPHLSIIDGWEGMEGDGPTLGDPVPWRVALASSDFLAADALAAELMGYPIDGVGYLHYCQRAELGVGRREQMTIVGNVAPDEVRREFRAPVDLAIQRRWGIRDTDRWLRAALGLNDGHLSGPRDPSAGTRRSND